MSEEGQYWRRLIEELQASGFTLERIAEAIGVSDRQVSNWKNGDRPKGLNALNLYSFHVKHRNSGSVEPQFITSAGNSE